MWLRCITINCYQLLVWMCTSHTLDREQAYQKLLQKLELTTGSLLVQGKLCSIVHVYVLVYAIQLGFLFPMNLNVVWLAHFVCTTMGALTDNNLCVKLFSNSTYKDILTWLKTNFDPSAILQTGSCLSLSLR